MFKAGQCIFIRKSLAVDVSEMGIGKGIDGFINAGGVQGDFGCIIDKKPSRAPGGVFCVEVPGGKGSKKRRRVLSKSQESRPAQVGRCESNS